MILPIYNGGEDHVFHLFVIRTKDRNDLMEFLKANAIGCLIHYPVPPHKQQALKEYDHLSFPVSEKIHNEVLSLPMSPVMTDDEVTKVIEVLNNY